MDEASEQLQALMENPAFDESIDHILALYLEIWTQDHQDTEAIAQSA